VKVWIMKTDLEKGGCPVEQAIKRVTGAAEVEVVGARVRTYHYGATHPMEHKLSPEAVKFRAELRVAAEALTFEMELEK